MSENNPFVIEGNIDIKQLYVAFLKQTPEKLLVENLKYKEDQKEEFVQREKLLYLNYPDGYGKSKFNNNYIERKLNLQSTIRNWKTILKLVEISKNMFDN